jgi:hypothetical protein
VNTQMRGKSSWSAEGRYTALYISECTDSPTVSERGRGIKEDSRGIGGVILHLHLKRSDILIHVDKGYGFSCFTLSNVWIHIFKNGKASYHRVTSYKNTNVSWGEWRIVHSVTASSWGILSSEVIVCRHLVQVDCSAPKLIIEL